jgi:hypothetical protein
LQVVLIVTAATPFRAVGSITKLPNTTNDIRVLENEPDVVRGPQIRSHALRADFY